MKPSQNSLFKADTRVRSVAENGILGLVHQFLRKGRKVYLEGRLQTRPYTGQDGIEKYATEIVLEKLEMLDSMPKEVRQTMELEDALADTSKGAPSQQV
jgi:single-stranded DNA-binding protein